VGLLRVSVDESGTHDKDARFCIALCLGTKANWRDFRKAWGKQAPKDYHAKDASPETNRGLAVLMERHLGFCHALSIDQREFRENTSHRFRSVNGGVYSFLFIGAATRAMIWAKEHGEDMIAYVIEHGCQGASFMKQELARVANDPPVRQAYRIHSDTWVGKGEVIVHPADLVAHEFACHKPGSETPAYERLKGFVEYLHMDGPATRELTDKMNKTEREVRALWRRAKKEGLS
jgi:hypothetical protein